MKLSIDEDAKFRSSSEALCVSLPTRELEKKSKNAAKAVPTQGQSIEALPKIRKRKRLRRIITAARIYDRRVHVISSKETKDGQRILPQDFSAISIFSSQLVRLSFQNNPMPADSDAVYALIKLSITQVDFQNNSIPIDSDAEYALIKAMRDQAVSTDSDSDSEYALIETAMNQARFKENSESVNSDAKYWLTIVQKVEALCTNLSLYLRDSGEYYALIPSPFIKQPKARSITLPELVKEVDDIYVGIRMIEAKCIALHSIV